MSAAARPTASAVRPYQFPAVHRTTLANGLRLVVARMPRLPIVTALALVDVGAAGDPQGAEGLAALMARTLDEGTGGLDGAALTDRFESLGTSFEAAADWDSVVARLTVSPSRLETAFALFAQVLRAPSFPVADVARTRDERLDDLAQLLAEPRGLADMRFSGFLYGPGARYGRPAGGTASSVALFDAAAVRAFHARHVGPSTTTLIFVGDVTPEDAERTARIHFGDWRADVVPGTAAHERVAPERRRVVVVDKPDAPQSELRVGHIGVPRAHPDHLAIVVMNAILGGLFSSRINLNLRERNAFTYGASSGFDWRRGRGPFVVNTAVRSDVTARAVSEVLAEIDAMRAAPPAPAEVSLATDYLAGVFPIRYETTAAVAGALAGAAVYGLDEDWFRTYRDRVRAIGPADVLAAAQAHLDPSRLLVLAVGDARTVEGPLTDLAIAPATVHAATFDPTE
jgi:zinc protease